MAGHCQVTGKAPTFGNNVSHSHRRTRRRFNPNIQNKRFWFETERRFIRLRVSTKGIKTIEQRGIDVVVKEMRNRGEKV